MIMIKICTALYAFLLLTFVLIASGSTFLYWDEGCLLFSTPSQFQARLSVNRAFVCAVVHEFIDTGVPNRDRRDCVWAGCWTHDQVSPDVVWRHEICMLLWPSWVTLQQWLFFSDDIGLAAEGIWTWRTSSELQYRRQILHFPLLGIPPSSVFVIFCFCSQLLAWTEVRPWGQKHT